MTGQDDGPGEELGGGGNSIWDDLKREHAHASGAVDPFYLAIPAYTGVVARYRYVPLEDTKASTNRAMKVKDMTDLSRLAAIDSILLALDELMVVSKAGTVPVGRDGRELYSMPLAPLGNAGEPPLKFDEVLAERMGWDLGPKATASQILRRFFANDDYAILEHSQEIASWTNTARRAVAEELAGK